MEGAVIIVRTRPVFLCALLSEISGAYVCDAPEKVHASMDPTTFLVYQEVPL